MTHTFPAVAKRGASCRKPTRKANATRPTGRRRRRAFSSKARHQLDWGMKNRLARTFNPASGRTVMLAIDHGYFQGPTSGLERIDLSILPLLPSCDALFCTRGILRVDRAGGIAEADGAARQRRPEHPARGIVRRADRHGHGRRGAAQRRRRRHPGLHRRRARDALDPQHDQAGRCRLARRHAGHGRHRGRQEHGARRQILPPRLPHHRRARRPIRQDLLCRGRLRDRHRRHARCRS